MPFGRNGLKHTRVGVQQSPRRSVQGNQALTRNHRRVPTSLVLHQMKAWHTVSLQVSLRALQTVPIAQVTPHPVRNKFTISGSAEWFGKSLSCLVVGSIEKYPRRIVRAVCWSSESIHSQCSKVPSGLNKRPIPLSEPAPGPRRDGRHFNLCGFLVHNEGAGSPQAAHEKS